MEYKPLCKVWNTIKVSFLVSIYFNNAYIANNDVEDSDKQLTCTHKYNLCNPTAGVTNRGHQQGLPTWSPRHQVVRTDLVGRPRACSDNSINMISVFALMNIVNFYEWHIIEDKLSKFLFQKCVYQTGNPSHESVPRSSSQFQKGWWPLLYTDFQFLNLWQNETLLRTFFNWTASAANLCCEKEWKQYNYGRDDTLELKKPKFSLLVAANILMIFLY